MIKVTAACAMCEMAVVLLLTPTFPGSLVHLISQWCRVHSSNFYRVSWLDTMVWVQNVQLLSALPKANIILLYLSELPTCPDMLLVSVARETCKMLCTSATDFILFSCDQHMHTRAELIRTVLARIDCRPGSAEWSDSLLAGILKCAQS